MKTILLLIPLLLCTPANLFAQKPEKQISFARESKPHSYYVTQAGLWWKEVEKDKHSEENWYNYFRACRNAHGTADWRSDFANESPYLRNGDSIIALINQNIPNTFTSYYLSYLNQGIGTDNAQYLLKAYAMNPNFEGIHSSVVSYAESSLNRTLRKSTNEAWHKTNYLSYQLLAYAYNVLMSLDSNAILFTQHDNDTYPLWMLQDALDVRTDVTVINIDFLLLDDYRKTIYRQLKVPELDLGKIDLDEYHTNWRKVLTHILKNYKSRAPVYLGMTVAGELYKDFEKHLYPSGLAYKFSTGSFKTEMINQALYENIFMLDYLYRNLYHDINQINVDYQNLNYLNCFERVYNHYKSQGKYVEAKKVKELSLLLAGRISKREYTDWVNNTFN